MRDIVEGAIGWIGIGVTVFIVLAARRHAAAEHKKALQAKGVPTEPMSR
jgi:hypothetical protein